MKDKEPTEQYFPVVLFINLYKVVLTFESVDEILKCAISQCFEVCRSLHSCGLVCYGVGATANKNV